MLSNSLLLTSQLALMALGFLLQGEPSDFQDLGKLLAIGFGLALAAGVAFTVIRLRLREKKPAAAFLSINSDAEKSNQ
jgi:hypothetical protein